MAVHYQSTRDVPLTDLTRYPGNARRGDVDQIQQSLRRHGQYRSLVVRDVDGQLVILAGNHTFDALRAEGHDTARCELLTCTDDEGRRINLADNRLAELGTYDNDALVELLSYLDEDYAGTGYTDEFVDALVHPPVEELPPALNDPDDAPPPPPDPISQPGDLWLLGEHRLLCGDSTNPDDITRVTDGIEPGIIYTDPPYGISVVGADGKIGDKVGNRVPTTFYMPVAGDSTTDTAADAFRLLTTSYPQAMHVWWGGNHYAAAANLPNSPCWLVWDKENSTTDFADAELAWTNKRGSVRLLRHMWNGMIRASERGKRVHPTQKPVALAEWAFSVVDSKNERRTVLDAFGGSGSTLIAAHQTGRVAFVIEMEPAYIDVICRRYQEHTGTLPVLASTGEEHDFTAP